MKRALVLALIIGCGGGGGGKGAKEPAAERPPKLLPVPDELKADVEQAQRIGALLFRLDRATARATDEVLAQTSGKPDERVQGWIALPIGESAVEVYFLGDVGGEVRTFYIARMKAPDAAPEVRGIDGGEPADPVITGMFRARQIAAASAGELLAKAGTELCESYNTLVLPGEVRGHDGHLVYLLAATTDPQVTVLAGHHRIHVAPDGTATAEPMSKGCVMSRPQPPSKDFQAVGAFVTHVLTPFPLESHVFSSLNHGIDLIVATSQEKAWMITKGEVHAFSLNP